MSTSDLSTKVYRVVDRLISYIAPTLFLASAISAYQGDLQVATFLAVWAVGVVTMFNRFELDQLRRQGGTVHIAYVRTEDGSDQNQEEK